MTPRGLQVAPSPICQHRGPSLNATCPLHTSPPNSCTARPACGSWCPAVLRVTLQHKQLCSSLPVNYIMSNEQDQAEGIKP